LHFFSLRNDLLGPLQREEAVFLFGIIATVKPKTVVEFGFHWGHSAFNFLQAMDKDAHLFSFDISEVSKEIAENYFDVYKNFSYLHKSQQCFVPEDVDGRKIDFVFIDCSHDLSLNQKTFEALLPALTEQAIIAVHDTGTWIKEFMLPVHSPFLRNHPNNWINDREFQPCKDNRLFMNWIAATHPEFQIIHFHSKNCARQGVTLIQRARLLKTDR